MVESATEVDNKLVWGVTKTYEWRTVRLPRFLCEQVGAYLVDRPLASNDLVFTMLQGGPLREPKFADLADRLDRLHAQAGVPSVYRRPGGRSRARKGLVTDQAFMGGGGRLQLPCLVILVYRPHAAPMAASGC